VNKISYVKNYFSKIVEVEAEMRKYSTEEIQYVESRKLETNIIRIQLISILVIAVQLLHLIANLITKDFSYYAKWYLGSEVAMIVVIVLHEFVYNLWIKKLKKNKIIGIRYVISWYVCVSLVMVIFLVIDATKNGLFYEFFILNGMISVVLLMKTKIHLGCSTALFLIQLMMLLITDASPTKYQISFLSLFGAFLIGRILYVEFVRLAVMDLRLKTTVNELNLQNERFSILQSLTQETIFEYNFKEDTMKITNGSSNETKLIYNYIEKLKHQYHVSVRIDVKESINVYKELIYGKKRDYVEFPYEDKDGTIKYSRALFTTIYEGDHPVRLIGKMCKRNERTFCAEET